MIATALLFLYTLWANPAQPEPAVRLLEQLSSGEPQVGEVQRMALAYHRLDGALDVWSRRARWSGAAPDLEVRTTWQHTDGDTLEYREDQVRGDTGLMLRDFVQNDLEQARQRRRITIVRARVELGRLVFEPREIQAAREASRRRLDRDRLLVRVAQVYHARRADQVRYALTPEEDVESRVLLLVEIQEHTATLDALTGGRFSRAARVTNQTNDTNQRPMRHGDTP
ncbi:MAG: hypothetical protein AAGI01_06830 [Myxococcota bacterium]